MGDTHLREYKYTGRRVPYPASTLRSHDADSMLGQRSRRWTNIEPALSQCLVLGSIHAAVAPHAVYIVYVSVHSTSKLHSSQHAIHVIGLVVYPPLAAIHVIGLVVYTPLANMS